MRYVQSAARVAETKTEAVSKGVNSAGPLGAAWPCFECFDSSWDLVLEGETDWE